MTSSENTAGGIRPRPVVDLLPRYAAGKPPVPVEGLASYKLSSNENPLPPIPAVQQAIAAQTDFNRYPDPLSSKLRGALAEFLDVPAEDIVTGAGSLGALNQLLATFAGQNDDGKPDEVIYAWRSFEAYPICVGLAGAESVRIPLTGDGRHDLDAMAAAVTARTRMILLCTPNNPTGPILTTEETERFIKRVPSDVVVVIDEAYQEFVRDEHAVDGIEMYRKYPNVVVLRTFSKAHGLAGLRVGYSVSQPGPHAAPARRGHALRGLPDRRDRGRDVAGALRRGCRKGTKPGGRTGPRHRRTAGPRLVRAGGPGQLRLAQSRCGQCGIRRPGGGAGTLRARLRQRGRAGQHRRDRGQHPLPGTLCDLYKTAAAFLALNMTAAASPLRIK